MKAHYLVLALFSFILFTNTGCDEDDNIIINEPEQVEFTTTNYIYEGDLRKYYLETENTRLNDSIAVWQQVPDSDPNYGAIQISIAEANAEITGNNEEVEGISTPGDQFFIINPIPPIPVPLPCLCLNEYNSIRNIVLQQGTDQMSLTITSIADQSTLVSTNADTQIHTIPNTNNLGRYQSFALTQDGFTGEAKITVETENGSYSFLGNFHNLE